MNIIFTTSSCKSTEVAFGEKTFINKFPARCYSRFGSNVTSCLQLPILPCSKKTQSTVCPISCINPAAFPICCGSAWAPLELHLTLVDQAKAQSSMRSIGQPKTWIPYFISPQCNLQHSPPHSLSSSKAAVWTAKGTGIYYRQNKNWVAKGRLTAAACWVLLSGTLWFTGFSQFYAFSGMHWSSSTESSPGMSE